MDGDPADVRQGSVFGGMGQVAGEVGAVPDHNIVEEYYVTV